MLVSPVWINAGKAHDDGDDGSFKLSGVDDKVKWAEIRIIGLLAALSLESQSAEGASNASTVLEK